MRSFNKFIVASVAALSMPLLSVGAQASAIVSFGYQGMVDSTYGGAPFDAFLGQDLKLTFSYSTGMYDSEPDPSQGIYEPLTFDIQLGSYSYHGTDGALSFLNDDLSGSTPTDYIDGLAPIHIPGLDGLDITALLSLEDDTGSAIWGDTLPDHVIGADAFSSALVGLYITDSSSGDLVGLIGASNATEVPEPGTWTLFAVGLAGLGMITWRRRANGRKTAKVNATA